MKSQKSHPQDVTPKSLTKSRLVHSIESSLDPSSYDEKSYLNRHWETFIGYLGPKSNTITKMIIWSSYTPPITVENGYVTSFLKRDIPF